LHDVMLSLASSTIPETREIGKSKVTSSQVDQAKKQANNYRTVRNIVEDGKIIYRHSISFQRDGLS
jgi:hypothetical protein